MQARSPAPHSRGARGGEQVHEAGQEQLGTKQEAAEERKELSEPRAKEEPGECPSTPRRATAASPASPASPSPMKKIKMELTADEARRIKVPRRWQEVYELLSGQRKVIVTPVDIMGCAENGADKWRADRERRNADGTEESAEDKARRHRFTTLVSLMLSSQTKDHVTADAVHKLQTRLPNGLTLASLRDASSEDILECIGKVGFYRRKLEHLQGMVRILEAQHGGDVPRTIDELCEIPGVGPKMAFLQMQFMGLNVGIGVDTHVHRISNRLGWCKTNTPEQTRLALQSWLPKELHPIINKDMVGFGQVICLPVSPRCEYVTTLTFSVCATLARRNCAHRTRKWTPRQWGSACLCTTSMGRSIAARGVCPLTTIKKPKCRRRKRFSGGSPRPKRWSGSSSGLIRAIFVHT